LAVLLAELLPVSFNTVLAGVALALLALIIVVTKVVLTH
jgi:hypothetical protein